MNNITNTKNVLRQSMLKTRGMIDQLCVKAHNESASKLFQQHIQLNRDDVIAGYYPIGTELSPLSLLEKLSQRTCLPVVLEKNTPLIFYAWQPGQPLEDSYYGTRIPVTKETVIPDIVIVPLLAWNKLGARLGYGGGFYDRTLAQLRQNKTIYTVGYGFDVQEVLFGLPVEATDIPLDAVVTESRFIHTKKEL